MEHYYATGTVQHQRYSQAPSQGPSNYAVSDVTGYGQVQSRYGGQSSSSTRQSASLGQLEAAMQGLSTSDSRPYGQRAPVNQVAWAFLADLGANFVGCRACNARGDWFTMQDHIIQEHGDQLDACVELHMHLARPS